MQSLELLMALTGAARGREINKKGLKYELGYNSLAECHRAVRQLQLGGYAASKVNPGRKTKNYTVIINFSGYRPEPVQDDYYGDLSPKSVSGAKDSLQKHIDARFSDPTPESDEKLALLQEGQYLLDRTNTQAPIEPTLFYRAGEILYRETIHVEDMKDVLGQMKREGFENAAGGGFRKKQKSAQKQKSANDDSWLEEAMV